MPHHLAGHAPHPVPEDGKSRESFGHRLSRLLEVLDVSQAELAEALGVTPGAVSQWISGRVEPKPIHLLLLAEFFSTDVAFLLLGRKRELPPEHQPPFLLRRGQRKLSGWRRR